MAWPRMSGAILAAQSAKQQGANGGWSPEEGVRHGSTCYGTGLGTGRAGGAGAGADAYISCLAVRWIAICSTLRRQVVRILRSNCMPYPAWAVALLRLGVQAALLVLVGVLPVLRRGCGGGLALGLAGAVAGPSGAPCKRLLWLPLTLPAAVLVLGGLVQVLLVRALHKAGGCAVGPQQRPSPSA